MIWERDSDLKQRLLQGLTDKNNPRGGRNAYITELTLCMRKAWFQRFQPQPPTEVELGFYLDGSRRHEVLQYIYGEKSEVKVEKDGLVGHIDILDQVPIEFKSTRSFKDAVSGHYERQIAYYCILLGTDFGKFIIQKLFPRGGETFQCFQVRFRDAFEKTRFITELTCRRDLYLKAIMNQDPSCLPVFVDDYQDNSQWLCRNCLYKEVCNKVG
jgi:CRISPR/Cas system-associated exonuclease Cas4 (RecB family)